MPTEAFFNLKEERKEKLLQAAVHEFSEHPYSKVSVFKIAQNAEISRSAFYYYFKDKRDIYEYLIEGVKEGFLQNLGEVTGPFDLFWFSEKLFDYMASIKGTELESFFKNLVANANPESINQIISGLDCSHIANNVEAMFDLRNLTISNYEELKEVVFLLASGIMYSVGGYLTDQLTLEEARAKQQRMSNIVKEGILLKRSEG